MSTMASQINTLMIVYSTVYSRGRSKKTSKLRVTGLCDGNSPMTGEFPSHRAGNAESGSIWRRHHVTAGIIKTSPFIGWQQQPQDMALIGKNGCDPAVQATEIAHMLAVWSVFLTHGWIIIWISHNLKHSKDTSSFDTQYNMVRRGPVRCRYGQLVLKITKYSWEPLLVRFQGAYNVNISK